MLYSLDIFKDERVCLEEKFRGDIDNLQEEVEDLKINLEQVTFERDEALNKCKEMYGYIFGLRREDSIDLSHTWGNSDNNNSTSKYEQRMKEILVQHKNRIRTLEEENKLHREAKAIERNKILKEKKEVEKEAKVIHDLHVKFKHLLSESNLKLTEKDHEVSRLMEEIKRLKLQQRYMKKKLLQRTGDDSEITMPKLIKKYLKTEQKMLYFQNIVSQQKNQIRGTKLLLQYKENIIEVLRASRNELIIQKDSLARFCGELTRAFTQVNNDDRIKNSLIRKLQEKIDEGESKIAKIKYVVSNLKKNMLTNSDQRDVLHHIIMEDDLNSSMTYIKQLEDKNRRYGIDVKHSRSNSSFKSSKTYSLDDTISFSTSTDASSNYAITEEIPSKYVNNSDDLCFNQRNCKSLIGHSLNQVNYLKTRLRGLTQVRYQFPKDSPSEHHNHNQHRHHKSRKSSQKQVRVDNRTFVKSKSTFSRALVEYTDRHRILTKIIELTAKRYEYFQQQAYESYEELTDLVKMAALNPKLPCD